MTLTLFRGLLSALAVVVVAGCSSPETPQEVAEAFWQAVAENDANDVAELSTLASAADFDGFRRDWTDAVPSFGRIVIDNGEATIVTRLPPEEGAEGERLELITYLVQGPEGWRVDYDRTGDAILNPSPFGNLMGELNRLGEKLSASFSSSSDELENSMNEFARNFEAYSADVERRAEDAIEAFGKLLQQAIEELEESINEAMEEDGPATPEDRVILEQASRSLDREVEALDEPSMESLAGASRTLAETGQRFTRLSRETYSQYREDWEARLEAIRADTEVFFADLRQALTRDS